MDIYDDLFPSIPRSPEMTEESLNKSLLDQPPTPEEMFTLLEGEEDMLRESRKRHPQYNPATGRIEIKSVSHMHEAIMNWMLLNPGLPMRYCADEFGVSQSWLSTLKNSNLFRARLAEKQKEVDVAVQEHVLGLEEKMKGVAELGVERLGQMVETTKDPKFLLDVTDKILNRLGHGKPPPGPGQASHIGEQNNFYVTSSAELARARDKIRGKAPPADVVLPLTGSDKG